MDRLLNLIEELEDNQRQLTSDLADIRAKIYMLEKKKSMNTRDAGNYGALAKEHAKNGNEAAAKNALTKKVNLENLNPNIDKMLEKLHAVESQMVTSQTVVENKIAELDQAKTTIELQMKYSSATGSLGETVTSSALKNIDKILEDAEFVGRKEEELANINFEDVASSVEIAASNAQVDEEYKKLLDETN